MNTDGLFIAKESAIKPPPMTPIVGPSGQSKESIGGLSERDVEKLESLSKDELVALIKRVSGAIWGYALQDDAERAEAARLKLYNMGMSATEVHKVVPALDKWFDRTSGKAPQSLALTVENKGLNQLTDEKLLRLEKELARMTGQDAVLIAPEPVKPET